MRIIKFLALQLLFQGTFARICNSVKRNRLIQSCMICNQLVQTNFPAAFGTRIKAACIMLSRNQCCLSNHQNRKHETGSHKLEQFSQTSSVNGFKLLQTALIWSNTLWPKDLKKREKKFYPSIHPTLLWPILYRLYNIGYIQWLKLFYSLWWWQ